MSGGSGLASGSVAGAGAAYMGFTAITTGMSTAATVYQGWNEVHIHEANLAAVTVGEIHPPPINGG